MAAITRRLLTELHNRGPLGFVRFVGRRLAVRQSDVLFVADPLELGKVTAVPPLASAVLVDRNSVGRPHQAAVEAVVLGAENHAYREAVRGADWVLAGTDAEGRVMTYGFVLFESFYKRLLGEAGATPMISNCYTLPEFRRQGLYARLLVSVCAELARRGHRRAIITCAPDNVASMRGIENAGFRRDHTIESVVLFARWIVWQRRLP